MSKKPSAYDRFFQHSHMECLRVLADLDLVKAGDLPRQLSPAAKVLIIEDDPSCRDFLRRLIEGRGNQCCLAGDGQSALRVISDHPDIAMVFLDLRMPRLDGWGFLKLMKSMQLLAGIPVTIVTGELDQELIRRAVEYNIVSYLVKPLRAARVRKILSRLG